MPVRLSVEVSDEMNQLLERLSVQLHSSKADVLRRAVALMQVAVTARAEGKKLGIAEPSEKLSTEIVGLGI